jgi:hypothetical protein
MTGNISGEAVKYVVTFATDMYNRAKIKEIRLVCHKAMYTYD